jgi:UDP-glucose-4-epimerase GalE
MAAADTPTVLVTGGAGYIGSHVCKVLAASGCLPVAYDNLSTGHSWAVRWGPLANGELEDGRRLKTVLERYRPFAVVHLAGRIIAGESVADPAAYYRANVTASLALLDGMRDAGVARIVFSSSAAVYGEPEATPMAEEHPQRPVSPYGASKLMVERILTDYAHAYGLRSASLRYFNAAGADPEGEVGEAHPVETHLIPLVLDAARGRLPHVSICGTDYPTRDGTCLRDYVHVSDLASAHVLALRHVAVHAGAHAFNLGGGEGATVREVIETARQVTGRPIAVRQSPRRPGDPAALLADSARARQSLGWRPAHQSLAEQIETAWNWVQLHEKRASLVEPLGIH